MGPTATPKPDASIDDRPRLDPTLAVFDRGVGEVQIGLSDGRGLVLRRVPAGTAALVGLFDGRHRLEDVRAAATTQGLDPGLVDWVHSTLRTAELLTGETGSTPARPGRCVRVVGAGPLGRAVALRLLELGRLPCGLDRVEISDGTDADRHLYPQAQLGDSSATALVRLLGERIESTGRQLGIAETDHWHALVSAPPPAPVPGSPAPGSGTITLLCPETAEVDRAVSDRLLHRDEAHLVLGLWPDGAVVGPFVDPGRSPCLNCLDLTRTQADPAWPRLLHQLTRLPVTPSPLLTDWAATTALLQVAGWLADRRIEARARTIQLRGPHLEPTTRTWRIRPECGCAWPPAAR